MYFHSSTMIPAVLQRTSIRAIGRLYPPRPFFPRRPAGSRKSGRSRIGSICCNEQSPLRCFSRNPCRAGRDAVIRNNLLTVLQSIPLINMQGCLSCKDGDPGHPCRYRMHEKKDECVRGAGLLLRCNRFGLLWSLVLFLSHKPNTSCPGGISVRMTV